MTTRRRPFTYWVRRAGPPLVLLAGFVLPYVAGVPDAVLLGLVIICTPIGLRWRGFDRERGPRDSSNPLATAHSLSGSPVALITLGFAMTILAWRFSNATLALFGTTSLVLATVVSIGVLQRRARLRRATFGDVVLDVVFGASGWAMAATVGVVAMILASPDDARIAAGLTAVSCAMAMLFPRPLPIGERVYLRMTIRREAVVE